MFQQLSSQIAGAGFGALTANLQNVGGRNISSAGAIVNKAATSDAAKRAGKADAAGAAAPESGGSTGGASSTGGSGGALPVSLEEAAVHTLIAGTSPAAGGGFHAPYGLGALLSAIPGKVRSGSRLRARDDGAVNLAGELVGYLEASSTHDSGACVAVSLANFTNACKRAGCATDAIFGGVEVPLIADATGALIALRNFFYLWYSRADVGHWLDLPRRCRGAGAPGALLYADLVAGREYRTSATGWPAGLLPGALLQLWQDEDTYHRVRDVGGTSEFGHSCIFREYRSGDAIVVADQGGLEHVLRYPYLRLTYVIGANLKNAELVA
jgi:hypothetical protein